MHNEMHISSLRGLAAHSAQCCISIKTLDGIMQCHSEIQSPTCQFDFITASERTLLEEGDTCIIVCRRTCLFC